MPGFVGNRDLLADVGVILLMFGLGVAFSLKDLARVRAIAAVACRCPKASSIIA